MNVKRILLTGDDGYNAIGIRLLVHILKHKYDLSIAATRDQMSGVGGHLSLQHGGRWGETEVDGVPAVWYEGYPCDAMECSVAYYKKEFDVVISGINLGINVGGAIVSSGTYTAAIRAVNLHLASKALALSWHSPASLWHTSHNGKEELEKYKVYPGQTAGEVLDLAIANAWWGADILNVNFPAKPSRTIRFTKGLPDLRNFFTYPIPRDYKTKTYRYPNDGIRTKPTKQLMYDTESLLAGYISVTPYKADNLDESVYTRLKRKVITL